MFKNSKGLGPQVFAPVGSGPQFCFRSSPTPARESDPEETGEEPMFSGPTLVTALTPRLGTFSPAGGDAIGSSTPHSHLLPLTPTPPEERVPGTCRWLGSSPPKPRCSASTSSCPPRPSPLLCSSPAHLAHWTDWLSWGPRSAPSAQILLTVEVAPSQ